MALRAFALVAFTLISFAKQEPTCEDNATSPASLPPSAIERHRVKLAEIASAMSERKLGETVALARKKGHAHTAPNRYRSKLKRKSHLVDVSSLDEILAVDVEERTALVESRVTFEQLVRELLPSGLVPCVVPEFRMITVGGAIQGLAAESTSHRYGFVHDICDAYEVMLSNGTVVTTSSSSTPEEGSGSNVQSSDLLEGRDLPNEEDSASEADREDNNRSQTAPGKGAAAEGAPEEANSHAALHHALAGSYGSFGILTSAQIRLCPAKPYVRLEVRRWDSAASAASYLRADRRPETEFVEGFGFSETFFVSVEGFYSSAAEAAQKDAVVVKFNSRFSPWFYKVVEKHGKYLEPGGREYEDFYTPTEDYLFRHDRGAFWMASYRIPHPLGRLLGGALSSRRMFKLASSLPLLFPPDIIVLQDFLLPASEIPSFVEHLSESLSLWPLWLLPMRNDQKKAHLLSLPSPESGGARQYINCGAYGIPRNSGNYSDYRKANVALEERLTEGAGRKVFYSDAFYSPEQFGGLYDMEAYEDLRRRYGADGTFVHIYDKVVTA